MEELTPIEKIFSEGNNENVILYNSKDEPVEFEQIAVVPIGDDDYCILKPVVPMEDMKDDEALVFVLTEHDGEASLDVVIDEKIVDQVFDVYYEMLDDAMLEEVDDELEEDDEE